MAESHVDTGREQGGRICEKQSLSVKLSVTETLRFYRGKYHFSVAERWFTEEHANEEICVI